MTDKQPNQGPPVRIGGGLRVRLDPQQTQRAEALRQPLADLLGAAAPLTRSAVLSHLALIGIRHSKEPPSSGAVRRAIRAGLVYYRHL